MHLGVCSFLERPADGTEFASGALPLHVTVLGNFRIDSQWATILDLVRDAAARLPIESHVGGDERFGPHGEWRVTVMEPIAALNELHDGLVAAVTSRGAVLDDPHFAGDGYRAHVTWPGGIRPALDSLLTLESLSVIDLEPDGDAHLRRVVATV